MIGDFMSPDLHGGFLVPPGMAAMLFPFSLRRDMRTGATYDPTLGMPRRLKKAARKDRDGARLGTREARRLWRCRLRLMVRPFVEGTGDPNRQPVGFLNYQEPKRDVDDVEAV